MHANFVIRKGGDIYWNSLFFRRRNDRESEELVNLLISFRAIGILIGLISMLGFLILMLASPPEV